MVDVRPTTPRARLRWLRDDPRGLMLLSVLGLVVLVGAAVLLATVGVSLSSAGVAGVGGSLVVLFVVSWRARRVYSDAPEAAAEVRALHEALERDAARATGRRESGASHDELTAALDLLEAAERELTHGDEPAAARRLATLARVGDGWGPEIGEQVDRLVARAAEFERLQAANVRTLRRRPTLRGRVPEPAEDPGTDLPPAELLPAVLERLHAQDGPGAARLYRAETGVGLAAADAAVRAAAERLSS